MNIELRPWQMQNAPALQQLCANADRTYLSDAMPNPYTLEDAKQWIELCQQRDGTQGIFRGLWMNDTLIANLSVLLYGDVRRKDGELGYLLDRRYWSKGIMTNAVGRLCTLAYQTLDIVRISALIYEPNIASRRVVEKNGFVLEGVLHQAIFKNGTFYNGCLYAHIRDHA